jgi:hypothetical protein
MAELEKEAKRAYRSVRRSPWLGRLARVGFLSKGIVYVLMGALALMAALHKGGETTDPRGVIRRVANEPFGEVALIAIACGLVAYSTWRFIAAFSDTERRGSGAAGLGARAGHFFGGVAYSLIAVYAVKLLMGGSRAKEAEMTQTWTATLLSAPGGYLLVGLGGLALIAVGVGQIWIAIKERFTLFLRKELLSGEDRKWVIRAGKAGYIARGVVFALIGIFLILAAVRADPGEAQGIEGVLDAVAGQRYGQWMLGMVAAGLACFGLYTMVEARYRRIPQ